MSCAECKDERDIEDLSSIYLTRECKKCGRLIKFRKHGKFGEGLQVNEGDRFVFPDGFFKLSANPLNGNVRLTTHGLNVFANQIFIAGNKFEPETIISNLEANTAYADNIIIKSGLVDDLDINCIDNADELAARLQSNKSHIAWWAYQFDIFSQLTRQAIDENDTLKAVNYMGLAERCRAMCAFKEHLEDVTFMGHSAGRIIDVIRKWHANKLKFSKDEAYWQKLFTEHPYIFTQIFSAPTVFFKGNMFVGGMKVDNSGGSYADFALKNELSDDLLLIEIKTPGTQLLSKRAYRGRIHSPMKELSGSVQQILDYKTTVMKEFHSLSNNSEEKFEAINPKCIVIVGNSEEEFGTEDKRRSFEIYRSGLKNVEVLTFDEVFKKAESIASIFSLKVNK